MPPSLFFFLQGGFQTSRLSIRCVPGPDPDRPDQIQTVRTVQTGAGTSGFRTTARVQESRPHPDHPHRRRVVEFAFDEQNKKRIRGCSGGRCGWKKALAAPRCTTDVRKMMAIAFAGRTIQTASRLRPDCVQTVSRLCPDWVVQTVQTVQTA
mgnify:CR=1 FL=1